MSNQECANETQPAQDIEFKSIFASNSVSKDDKENGIHLTDKAANHIKNIIKENNLPVTSYLYVGCKGGGCSGYEWVMDLRDEATSKLDESYELFSSNDIKIASDMTSYIAGNLGGTVIDYKDSLMGAGFLFDNAKLAHKCGCGKSFS